jgi:hypothetical protein
MAANRLAFVLVLMFTSGVALAQGDLQPIIDAQRVLERTAAESGMRSAFLASLADDAVVFQTGPVNGKEHRTSLEDDP